MQGKLLGKYRVERKLGAGGMGVVYVATHELLRKTVAIKVISAELSENQELVQRFFNEAIAASKVAHAGIVDVTDFGTDPESGCAYFVMEYLQGQSLSEYVAQHAPVAAPKIAAIGHQIADAVGAAHAEDIVHRDLKPDNVFLLPDRLVGERVKVLDFGIAKLAGEHAGAHMETAAQAVMGTPSYMSPEQARGAGEVDARTDIYALGCILFHMACGRPPFVGAPLEVLGYQQLVEAPDVRDFAPDVPAPLAALIARMLAKSPEARPQTMAAVMDELAVLAAVVTSPGVAAAGQGTARRITGLEPTQAPPTGPGTALGTGPGQVARPPIHTPGSLPVAGHTSLPGHSHPAHGAHAGSGEAPTTLGGAAAQSSPSFPASRKRPWGAIAGGVAVLAGAAVAAVVWLPGDDGGTDTRPEGASAVEAASQSETGEAPGAADTDAEGRRGLAVAEPPQEPHNAWIRVEPPADPVVLGVARHTAPGERSLLPEHEVTAPAAPFYLHAHEVTWRELEPWLADDAGHRAGIAHPEWVDRSADGWQDLPASGVTWQLADAYCRSLAGRRLPSEAEWEWAARGPELRRYPWGDEPLDRARTRVYAGSGGLVRVASSDQDRTPSGIRDLLGNAREWTADALREFERKGPIAALPFFAVRGLDPYGEPDESAAVGAAFRKIACSGEGCPEDTQGIMRYIGFRCAWSE